MRFLLLLLALSGQGAAAIDLQPIAVTPRVFYVQGKPGVASAENQGYNSNAGFVVTDTGVVVIDALGTPALGQALVAAIRHVTEKPIRRVIVTHYHADHFYGLKALKDAGADIWAHRLALEYLDSGEAQRRLEQRARDLFPLIDGKMPLVRADLWLDGDTAFEMGGVRFEVNHLGPAHSPEDVIVVVHGEGVIFSGDILFAGRIPFVGEADSKRWLERIDRLLALKPVLMVTGHGQVSRDPAKDLALTRDYLIYLRSVMGKAVDDLTPFDEAYAKTDWSRFKAVPAFDAANRINAYGTYLLMEKEMLRQPSTPDLSTVADGKSWSVFHAKVESTEKDGKVAVRLVAEGDSANGIVGLALPRDLTFSTGTIDIDLKGKNVRQRSFLGVAFNVVDEKTFEAVYFRPFNFKAADPIRNRSVQYIAWPTNTWEYLRKSAPGQFEKPVNPVPDPDDWFHAQIEVTASQVRVFVDHAKEPSLVVARLSSGGTERPVGLFVDSADGQYANLTVAPLKFLKP